MILFNSLVGLAIGVVIAIPLFFAKDKWLKITLLLAALASTVVGSILSENYLYPTYLGWEFERSIQKQPLFKLIAKHHSEEYAKFLVKVKASLHKDPNINIISTYSAELMNHIFYQHLQDAPDEAIFLYLKATVDLYRYLYTVDPRAVVKFENNDSPINVDLNALWQDKTFQVLLNHVLETKELVIEGSLNNPVTKNNENKPGANLEGVVDDLVRKFGGSVVRMVFSTVQASLPAEIAVPVIMDFYAAILSSGKENAGHIMRQIAKEKIKALATPVSQVTTVPTHPQEESGTVATPKSN